jgi:beta-galactosidase GanA
MPMSNKSTIQLKQEAAEIIAMGGGVQFYFQQNRDLSLKPWLATTLSELGTFCRERQAFCHKAKAIPQVALLFPTLSYQRNSKSVFSGSPEKLQATLYALLDNQYPVEVLMEYNLIGKTSQYPMIVIPECDTIPPVLLNELRTYVQNGGNLLVIGSETAGIFAHELGIQSSVKKEDQYFLRFFRLN